MSPDEKNEFATVAHKAVDHPSVRKAMEEFADNMGFELSGLPAYGLAKVAHYVAVVARAQALGIDPDELRYTPSEANSALLEKAAEMVFAGVPTQIVEPCPNCGGSGRSYFMQGGPHGVGQWGKCECQRKGSG